MARGKTKSGYSLQKRRQVAFKMYTKGHTDEDVAAKLNVALGTAQRYRRAWKERLEEEARNNPNLLKDVLQNTLQILAELDELRVEAWKIINHKRTSAQVKTQQMNLVLRIEDQRSRLLGLLGVKHDYFVMINNVVVVQNRLLEFMRRELCAEDRTKLETLLLGELAEFMEGTPALAPGVIEGSLVASSA